MGLLDRLGKHRSKGPYTITTQGEEAISNRARSDPETSILLAIRAGSCSVPYLSRITGLPPDKVGSIVGALEKRGLVKTSDSRDVRY